MKTLIILFLVVVFFYFLPEIIALAKLILSGRNDEPKIDNTDFGHKNRYNETFKLDNKLRDGND